MYAIGLLTIVSAFVVKFRMSCPPVKKA
jgi:hypothetical protein